MRELTNLISVNKGDELKELNNNLKDVRVELEKIKLADVEAKKLAPNLREQSAKILKDSLIPYKKIDYERSCTETKHICLLVQHIDKAPTLNQEFGTMKIS